MKQTITAIGADQSSFEPVAPDVMRLGIVFVNVYMIGAAGGPWVLVDTGLPFSAARTRAAAAARFGANTPPLAIILTHGHFDHAGSAMELAEGWDVPIYAHRLELPYLTGRSDYPPQDPTMGGAIAVMSRLFPHSGFDLGARVRPLPDDGRVPELPDWRWIYTPGHTHGHVSLFRDTDRTLLAGDALATMDLDSWQSMLTFAREFDRPAAPFTTDWGAARQSVDTLEALQPNAVGAGHGMVIKGPRIAEDLRRFADEFPQRVPPPTTRYFPEPARADESGVISVPPPASDPFPKIVAGVAAGAVMLMLLRRRNQRRPRRR